MGLTLHISKRLIATIVTVAVCGVVPIAKAHDANRAVVLSDQLISDTRDTDALKRLSELCTSTNVESRAAAAAALGRVARTATAADRRDFAKYGIPLLTTLLSDLEPAVRRAAATAAGEFGADAVALVPMLAERLSEGNCDIAWFSAESLGSIGPGARQAIPQLTNALAVHDHELAVEGQPQLAVFAARALGRIGDDSPDTQRSLEKILKNSTGLLRVRVGEALLRLKSNHRTALTALEEALRDPNVEARRATADVLAELVLQEVHRANAVRLLRIAIADADAGVRESAQFGLQNSQRQQE